MLNTIVYFFPKDGETLKADKTIDILKSSKIEFEPGYTLLEPSEDANNHLVDESGKIYKAEGVSVIEGFRNLLQRNNDIEIISDIMSIRYAVNDPNPNISIGWSRKWFHFLDEQTKRIYLETILEFANVSGASYVLFLEDLFDKYDDRFEDRFISINGGRFLDDSPKRQSGWDFMIDEIWIKEKAKLNIKSNRKLIPVAYIGAGFTSYKLS
jgi:hypothetical protein